MFSGQGHAQVRLWCALNCPSRTCFSAHNGVLPVVDRGGVQILLYLCLVLSVWACVLTLVQGHENITSLKYGMIARAKATAIFEVQRALLFCIDFAFQEIKGMFQKSMIT